MKTFLKIFGVFVFIFSIGFGLLAFLFYQKGGDFKTLTARYLAKNTPNAMEEASKAFVESCEKSAMESLQGKGLLTDETKTKIKNFCACSKTEFEKIFSSEEVMKIGLDKVLSQKMDIPQDKLNKIVDNCRSTL